MNDSSLTVSLRAAYGQITGFVQHTLSGKHWLWKLTLLCTGLSLFLAIPPYTVFKTSDAWTFIMIQADDLLHPGDLTHYIRRENMVMRWFLPVIARFTGHSALFLLILQGFLGVLFLFLIARKVFEWTGDKVTTAFLALGLSNIFVFSWFFVDTIGYGDGYAYLALLIVCFYRNPLVQFFALQCAFFTDERAVVAGGYVILWHLAASVITEKGESKIQGPFSLIRKLLTSSSTWTIIVAWVVYFSIRIYAMNHFFQNQSYSTVGDPVLLADDHRYGFGYSLWGNLEGFWLVYLAAAYVLWKQRNVWLLSLLLVGFGILVIGGIFVHDIDRALAYGFPFLLASVLVLTRYVPAQQLRLVFFVVAVICIVHPMCYTLGYNRILWAEPLPVKAFMLLDRYTGLGWFD